MADKRKLTLEQIDAFKKKTKIKDDHTSVDRSAEIKKIKLDPRDKELSKQINLFYEVLLSEIKSFNVKDAKVYRKKLNELKHRNIPVQEQCELFNNLADEIRSKLNLHYTNYNISLNNELLDCTKLYLEEFTDIPFKYSYTDEDECTFEIRRIQYNYKYVVEFLISILHNIIKQSSKYKFTMMHIIEACVFSYYADQDIKTMPSAEYEIEIEDFSTDDLQFDSAVKSIHLGTNENELMLIISFVDGWFQIVHIINIDDNMKIQLHYKYNIELDTYKSKHLNWSTIKKIISTSKATDGDALDLTPMFTLNFAMDSFLSIYCTIINHVKRLDFIDDIDELTRIEHQLYDVRSRLYITASRSVELKTSEDIRKASMNLQTQICKSMIEIVNFIKPAYNLLSYLYLYYDFTNEDLKKKLFLIIKRWTPWFLE